MEGKNENIDFDILILKDVEGTISLDEAKDLLVWIKASDKNKQHYQEMLKLNLALQKKNPRYDSAKAYEVFKKWKNAPKKRRKYIIAFMRVAAVVLILIGLFFVLQVSTKSKQTVLASNDDVVTYVLPDSSAITVNVASQIIFNDKFGRKDRELKLRGTAFFKVQPDKKKPFRVFAGNTVIEVLGTSFNVAQDSINKLIVVSVETGLVKVWCKNKEEELLLHPQERCVIRSGKMMKLEKISENDNYLSWATKELHFSNTSLKEVVEDLNDYYGCAIEICDSTLENLHFSSDIKDNSLDEALQIIGLALDIQVIQTDQNILLKAKN